MFAPPLEQQQLHAVPVGKFPWRLPPHERACHESVLSSNPARLLSPFTGLSGETTLTPDTLVEEARIALSGEEPYWYREVMPLWPALWQQTLVFVPVPTGGELVCVAVVSPEWQIAVLLPRRADVEWVLAHLRHLTPGPLVSIRPPPATQTDGQSARGAVDWRSGDVLLAFQRGGQAHMYGPPVFVSPEHVRYSAIWSYDFIVQRELPLLVCRAGRRPSGTTMPPPTRWVASEGAFTGRFRVKFPGRRVPVPWAYSDSITLCQRADEPDSCNILLERCEGTSLSFECRTVATAATRYSLAQIAQVDPGQVSLLGQGADLEDFPPLRDGDIVHYTVPVASNHNWRATPGWLVYGLACGSSRWGCLLSLLSFASGSWPRHSGNCVFGMPAGGPRITRASRRAGGLLAPFYHARQVAVASGSRRSPLWAESHVRPAGVLVPQVSPLVWCGPGNAKVVLDQLACYLPARGAPEWFRVGSDWRLDMTAVFRLQAALHRVWGSRALRDGLPSSFPRAYHATWGSYPLWSGGVPESILIATDGSGMHGGSWAFVVWGFFRGRWYRLGWDGMVLNATPWLGHLCSDIPSVQHSYCSELVALQAAAIWCNTALDTWRIHMGAVPASVTVAVDNSSALQVAAGSGSAGGPIASITRTLWQAVQGRVNTFFRHVHSHVGVMANTLADALAGLRLPCPLALLGSPEERRLLV